MTDILETARRWRSQGDRVAVATVTRVWGSAPRPLGSRMVISSRGEVTGSVSGGCVEAAVVDEVTAILEGGAPHLCSFGVTQEQAWSIGLPCGGEIEVLLTPWHPNLDLLCEARQRGDKVVLATLLSSDHLGQSMLLWPDGRKAGDLGSESLSTALSSRLPELLVQGQSTRVTIPFDEGGSVEFCIEVQATRPTLVMVGAVHITEVLLGLARTMGFRTVVVDPREAFATPERFAAADELIRRWPHKVLAEIPLDQDTYVALLSHDSKLDLPALRAVLRQPVRYIGALGSRRTHAKRVTALLNEGFTKDEVARIHAPIGLPLGGRRAEEIALSVMAEVVSVRYRCMSPS